MELIVCHHFSGVESEEFTNLRRHRCTGSKVGFLVRLGDMEMFVDADPPPVEEGFMKAWTSPNFSDSRSLFICA